MTKSLSCSYSFLFCSIWEFVGCLFVTPKQRCVRLGIQSEDESEFNTVKVRIFLQSGDKICVLALWHIAMICTLPKGGIEEYKPYPRFVLNVLVDTFCLHFECVDANIVLDLMYLCTLFHTSDLALNAAPRNGVSVYLCRAVVLEKL